MSEKTLRTVASGLHCVEAPQRFMGLEIGARMTVMETDAGVLVHSPVAVSPEILKPIGSPRWALAPNLFHHLYIGPWGEAGVETWAAPGLPAKRSDLDFFGTIDSSTQPFGPDIHVMPLACIPATNEVVVLHRPSRTLVVVDLVFNLPATAPWMSRAVMRSIGGYPGVRSTVIERFAIKRERGRQEFAEILSWEFDRLILAHGEVVETGGKEALRRAFKWLLP